MEKASAESDLIKAEVLLSYLDALLEEEISEE
jgi:hypothetical protein